MRKDLYPGRPTAGGRSIGRLAVCVLVAIASLAGCTGNPGQPDPGAASSAPGPLPCPSTAPDCLAWDGFDAPGPITEAPTAQPWEPVGLSCPDCRPVFAAHDSRATMSPGSDKNSVWLATVDTGRATGIEVISRITLSPTRERANVGLVGLFADRMNHLTCKLEVSEGHPDGLLAIGEERDGLTTSLLASRTGVGLSNGSSYRLALTIPTDPASAPVRCRVRGSGVERQAVAVRLGPESLAAFGRGTGQGLRIKIFDDEDDGGSAWQDFLVVPL